MDILVTGNGFDLAHEIPSSYKNFLEFVGAFDNFYKYSDSSSSYFVKQLQDISSKYKDIFKMIKDGNDEEKRMVKEFFDNTYRNAWIEYFSDRLKIRKDYGKEYNWVDIEEEISDVIRLFTDYLTKYGIIAPSANEELLLDKTEDRTGYSKLLVGLVARIGNTLDAKTTETSKRPSSADIKKWLMLKNRLSDDFAKMIRALEIYLDYFIDFSLIVPLQLFKDTYVDRVITFNYTNTYNALYEEKIIHFIHGKAAWHNDAKRNTMVIGINEFLPDELKNKDVEFIDYRKYYQRIVKQCDFSYRELLAEKDVNSWFFGHSMAASDKEILVHLLPSDSNKIKTSYICYHSDASLKQQVVNLVQVLGQDKLIELVGGANPQIFFVAQDELVQRKQDIGLKEYQQEQLKSLLRGVIGRK